MYNGTLHDTVITPRTPTSGKFPLDKKADLDELSQQMKVHIAQLKSLLGIKAKDEKYDLKSIEGLEYFGKYFTRELDRKEDELKLLHDDISKLYLISKRYPSPRRVERDTVSLPTTPRNSFMLEGTTAFSIPSKSSAFSPRFSTSSLSGKDYRQEMSLTSKRYGQENDDSSIRSFEKSASRSRSQRKSSSSLSSSTKASPHYLSHRDSHSSSSRRRSKNDVTDNSTSFGRKSQKLRDSNSSVRSSSSLNRSQTSEVKPKRESRHSNSHNSRSIEAKKPNKEELRRVKKGVKLRKHYSSDSDDSRILSEEEQDEDTTSIEKDSVEEEAKSVGSKRRRKLKKDDSSSTTFKEVERKLLTLQKRCDTLEEENENIKKEQHAKNNKKIADLKHRNSELVNIARRLEQKAKALHVENSKQVSEAMSESQTLEEHKKNFANIAAKMQSEHDKNISEKDREIKTMKTQLQDLKKALKEAKSSRLSQDSNDSLAAALKQSQKDSLQLQKLAAAGNKKVTIRSLSMPVTARQKILEESNRNLRRQVAQLEESYRQVCNGASADDLKSELESTKSKCETLEKEAKEAKVETVNLESQLQIAKVETSDTNIKLNELKDSFNQLQEEYSTVHEQLSVAIKERDAAIKQCKENTSKINEMELCIKNMEKHAGAEDETMNGKNGARYQIALEKLQAKVLELEKQCQEQNETNRLLNLQLMRLMKNSPRASPLHEKEIFSATCEAKSTPSKQASPLPVRNLEHVDQTWTGSPINVNVVNASPTLLPAKNQQHITREESQNIVVGNEDTEVEDFVEEELTQVMDNDAGKLRVYIAKYTYNPFEGPNESPEAELPLVAGDYVYVYGPMDEDGFFEGELMNGRRGLVPSNFLEPVHDETNSKSPTKVENSRGTNSEISQSESLLSSCTSLGSGRHSRRGDISDSNNSVIINGVLPYPRKLRIDKQLSHSLIIGWASPLLNDGECIEEYHVFVNSEFKTAVSGTKQKAVVENINHDKAYRISVCAVSHWGMSDQNLCVLSHGRGANLAPASVRLEKVAASNARVAWTPSSCQQCHIVTVEEEGQEIGSSSLLKNPTHMTHTVSPPAFRLTFGNLRPNVRYKITVSAKGSTDDPKTFTRFTTPEAGPPDPPLNVQIEECQNANYLLITWFPVTLNTLGTSNGVVVKGYSIHAADTKICEVQSPTIDQCTIRAQVLADSFKQQLSLGPEKNLYRLTKPFKPVLRWNTHVPPSVTIKTHAVNGQESDHSDPCIISQELYSKILNLIKDDIRSCSPKLSDDKHSKRPPMVHSVESTDLDVSFSSDIPLPGFHSPKLSERNSKDVRNSTDSAQSDSASRLHFAKSKLLQETRIVPSIEITQDTSSDDESAAHSGFKSRSSSNRSVENRRILQSDAGKASSVSSSPRAKQKSNVVEENHKNTYKNCDNDDAASVSSSHTSSSTGGEFLKSSKMNSVAKREAHVIQQHQLRRGESAEYSNSEDFIVNGTKINLIKSSGENRVPRQSPYVGHKQSHKPHHHNIRSSSRRPHSVASDDHSQGSYRSRSSSRHSHLRNGKPNGRRDIIRQSTMSSQSGSELASELESTYPIDVDRNKVSLYVALYSYDPQLMSPNTDTYEEELSFTEGQLIKVYGAKDEDGFYYGETHVGTRGYVPCNMVSQVEVENMQMLHDLHERGHLPSASPDEDEQSTSDAKTKSGSSQVQNGDQTDASNGSKRKFFVALFDYDPRYLSPNIDVDVEISFSRGDIITVYGDMDDDGFYKGKLGNKEGLVPSNFLEEISEQQVEALKQKSNQSEKRSNSERVSPVPKPRLNQNNIPNHRPMEQVPTYPVMPSTVNPNRVDNAKGKKSGFLQKGKKLFKKLGNSQDGKKR